MFNIGAYKNLSSEEIEAYIGTLSEAARAAAERAIVGLFVERMNEILGELSDRSTMRSDRASAGLVSPRDAVKYPHVRYNKPFYGIKARRRKNTVYFNLPETKNPLLAFFEPKPRRSAGETMRFPIFEGRLVKSDVVIDDVNRVSDAVFTGKTPVYTGDWATVRAARAADANNLVQALLDAIGKYGKALEESADLEELLEQLKNADLDDVAYVRLLELLDSVYQDTRGEVLNKLVSMRLKTKVRIDKIKNRVNFENLSGAVGTKQSIDKLERVFTKLEQLGREREAKSALVKRARSLRRKVKAEQAYYGTIRRELANELRSVEAEIAKNERRQERYIQNLKKVGAKRGRR